MFVQEVRSYALRREYNGRDFERYPLYKVIFEDLGFVNKLLIVLTILVAECVIQFGLLIKLVF